MPRNYLSLAAILILSVGGGLTIGVFNIPGEWYESLVKPSFNPPNWIFGPVWTILYVMIAISGWRLWENYSNSAAMKLWFIALGLNFLWSPMFFGMQNLALALGIILTLLILICAFIAKTFKIDRIAAWLFVPYAAWVTFASLLNTSIYMLN